MECIRLEVNYTIDISTKDNIITGDVVQKPNNNNFDLAIRDYITNFTENSLNPPIEVIVKDDNSQVGPSIPKPTDPETLTLVSEVIEELLSKSYESYTLLQRYNTQPKPDYMKRKLTNMNSDIINSFGSENLNYLNLKKGYSKVEQEKKILESLKKDSVNIMKEHKENKQTGNEFLSDAKVHKSKLEIEKEALLRTKETMLCKKREREEAPQSSESFMSNMVKRKSTIQIEKEKFIAEAKKQQEEVWKTKIGLVKSQVFKFDPEDTEIKPNNVKVEKPVSAHETALCEMCSTVLGRSSHKNYPKCNHIMHQVKYSS
jgi:hypothetical protein